MVEAIRYFTADYRDGRVYLGGKGKDAGYYAAQLLNEYDKDEFSARLAVFRTENWNTAKQLRTGFLDTDTYMKAGDEIRYILMLLPKLRPFSELDIQGELGRIEELFTEETAEQLCEYGYEVLLHFRTAPSPAKLPSRKGGFFQLLSSVLHQRSDR